MRRLLTVLLTALALLSTALALPVTGAGAQQDAEDEDRITAVVLAFLRLGGTDRYETSLLIAEQIASVADDELETVVLVSGERWPDAVVAAPLAGSLGAPVLMMPPDELRRDALEFLRRVGVSKAIAVGSTSGDAAHGPGRGLADSVLEGLRNDGIQTERVAGSHRFATAVAVAERLTPGDLPNAGRTAIIASGDVFADALVAGPFAVQGIHPVLLTPPGELHAEVATYLDDADIEHVVVMGGTAALAQPVEDALVAAGIEVSRLAGATRYDTAVLAAEFVENRYTEPGGNRCFGNDSYGLARADLPFDSFSSAPLLGGICASLLLTDPHAVPVPTAVYLDLKLQKLTEATDADLYLSVLFVFGGETAVQTSSLQTYQADVTERISEGSAGQIDIETEPQDGRGLDDEEPADDSAAALNCGGSIDDEPRPLLPDEEAASPSWSPDCTRIVFTDGEALWTIAPDGTDRQLRLRDAEADLRQPSWSPDRNRIAYVRRIQTDTYLTSRIWSVTADGTDPVMLVNSGRDTSPRWSPDGSQLVFGRIKGADQYLVTMNADGTNVVELTEGGATELGPVWSPDGTMLAYYSARSIWVSDTAGRNPRRVASGAFHQGGLSWSPLGGCIAYTWGDAAKSNISVINIVEDIGEGVTFSDGRSLTPRWSPDGKRITYQTRDRDGRNRLWVTGTRTAPLYSASGCGHER